MFVIEGEGKLEKIPSMPGIMRHSIDQLIIGAKNAASLGIPMIALFPCIDKSKKTETGIEAVNPDNLICRSVKTLKSIIPDLGIMCDVALDPYTTHGHDGLLNNEIIQNDETIEILCNQSLSQADAGCDIIAPSDMMDGRVGAIRNALDNAGHKDIAILSYAAKYASSLYSPFRNALGTSGLINIDEKTYQRNPVGKKTYQMNPANSDEALREVSLDIHEGADIVMVKPGILYLDVIARIKNHFNIPTFAYQVSGEYSMILAAAERGWINKEDVMIENLLAFKRAGADAILSYFAVETAKYLNNTNK